MDIPLTSSRGGAQDGASRVPCLHHAPKARVKTALLASLTAALPAGSRNLPAISKLLISKANAYDLC